MQAIVAQPEQQVSRTGIREHRVGGLCPPTLLGWCLSGQKDHAVNVAALPSEVRILPNPPVSCVVNSASGWRNGIASGP